MLKTLGDYSCDKFRRGRSVRSVAGQKRSGSIYDGKFNYLKLCFESKHDALYRRSDNGACFSSFIALTGSLFKKLCLSDEWASSFIANDLWCFLKFGISHFSELDFLKSFLAALKLYYLLKKNFLVCLKLVFVLYGVVKLECNIS